MTHSSQPGAGDPASGGAAGVRAASRVLIVRPSALGDVARTVPALVTLRRAYPEAEINWLVSGPFADAVRHHPALTKVVRFDRDWGKRDPVTRTVTEGWGFVGRLRRPRYDVVYDLQGLARSGLFTWLTAADRRVGFADAREGAWLGYNVRHSVNGRAGGPTHTVDRMLAILEADGLTPVRDMRLYTSEEDRRYAEGALAEARSAGADEGYVCVAPTARWGCKCWPLERYAEVARRLRAAWPRKAVVVLASPGELPRVRPAFEGAGVVFPTTTVGQMMALVAGSDLVVCNDSAALHVAVGFGRRIVALFGPTDPREVGPYGREETVLQPAEARAIKFDYRAHRDDNALIAKLGVDEVWARVEATLAG